MESHPNTPPRTLENFAVELEAELQYWRDAPATKVPTVADIRNLIRSMIYAARGE